MDTRENKTGSFHVIIRLYMRLKSGLELESKVSHARDVVLDELSAFVVCL